MRLRKPGDYHCNMKPFLIWEGWWGVGKQIPKAQFDLLKKLILSQTEYLDDMQPNNWLVSS